MFIALVLFFLNLLADFSANPFIVFPTKHKPNALNLISHEQQDSFNPSNSFPAFCKPCVTQVHHPWFMLRARLPVTFFILCISRTVWIRGTFSLREIFQFSPRGFCTFADNCCSYPIGKQLHDKV